MKTILAFALFLLTSFASADQKNIILIYTDDQTRESSLHMPYLQSKPYGNWIEFSHYLAVRPFCVPARTTMLHGEYDWLWSFNGHQERWDEQLGVWLQRAGYHTGWFGKIINLGIFGSPWIPPGFDDWRVFVGDDNHYFNFEINHNGTVIPFASADADYSTDVLRGYALEFLDANYQQPFFLGIGFYAPHGPRTPAPRHKNLTVPTLPIPPNLNEEDVSDKPAWVQALTPNTNSVANRTKEIRTVRAVDEALQAIMERLDGLGILNETIIIVTGDNGFSHSCHRYNNKDYHWEEITRLPLYIRYPGATQRTESRLTSNVDLNPTLMDISGGIATVPKRGTSLVPLLMNQAVTWRDAVLLARRDNSNKKHWGIRTEQFKYVALDTGEEELYDLVADPYELQSQHANPAFAAIKAELQGKLEALKP